MGTPELHVDVASLLVLLEDGHLGHLDVAVLEVDLARRGLEVQDLLVTGQGHGDVVDVRKLVARGVDCPVVGVALPRVDLSRDGAGHLPGGDNRNFGALERAGLVLEEGHVAFVAGVRNHLVECVLVGRRTAVDRLQVVRRAVHAARNATVQRPATRRVVGEGVEEAVLALPQLDLDRVVVDGGHAVDLHAGPADLAVTVRVDLKVFDHVLEVPDEVHRGERHAVRPLHALAEIQRVGDSVGADVPALGHVRDNVRAIEVVVQHLVHHQAVGVLAVVGAGERSAPRSAVVADTVHDRYDHHVLGNGKPILNGRYLTRRHFRGEYRGLTERSWMVPVPHKAALERAREVAGPCLRFLGGRRGGGRLCRRRGRGRLCWRRRGGRSRGRRGGIVCIIVAAAREDREEHHGQRGKSD